MLEMVDTEQLLATMDMLDMSEKYHFDEEDETP